MSWQALGASVQGAAHVRSGRPNQDACRIWPRQAQGPPLVLAVADGHGGLPYTRSQVGAGFAVRTAVGVLQRLLPQVDGPGEADMASIKHMWEAWLPRVLVRQWQERVQRYTRLHPLTPARLPAPRPPAPPQGEPAPVAAHPTSTDPALVPYGTTLVAALITAHVHLYLQLGDGDILVADRDGRVARPPLPEDPRLLANETTSLCSREAWRNVRLHFQPILDAPPALVLLATDGYANSFESQAGFHQVASDLLATLREPGGVATVQAELPGWLAATSAAGSGDDISVALAWRG